MEYYGFTVGDAAESVPHGEAFERLFDLVEVAERTGFDAWFFAEHHNPPMLTFVPSPNLMVAAASRLTSHIRLGVLVTILPYHHPLRVAEEIRMLDQLTHGRLEIGFGRGAVPSEQLAFGVDPETTPERLDVSMEAVLRLLTDGRGEYHSQWWNGELTTKLTPDAVQLPHPPMWAAVISPASLSRAARIGANVATLLRPLDATVEFRRLYREEWARYRPDEPCGKFSHGVTLAIAETREEVDRQARALLIERAERFARVFQANRQADGTGAQSDGGGPVGFTNTDFADLIDRSFMIYGSVDDAVEQTRRILDSGVDVLSIVPHFPGLDHEFARRSVELFATEVVPKADPSRAKLATV